MLTKFINGGSTHRSVNGFVKIIAKKYSGLELIATRNSLSTAYFLEEKLHRLFILTVVYDKGKAYPKTANI